MKKRWAILILAVAVFGSYASLVRDGFVWDDTALILRDPLVRNWRLIPEGFSISPYGRDRLGFLPADAAADLHP